MTPKNKTPRKKVPKPLKGGDDDNGFVKQLYAQLNDTSSFFDNSKLFAGFMLLILNITTKYVPFKLSPSVESFFKNSFGVEFFIFIILLVGTKNLFVSIVITGIFIIIFNYLLNEESRFSILPESFTQYYNNLDNNSVSGNNGGTKFSEKSVIDAKKILKDASDETWNFSPIPA
jgi:hypothetical protein